MSYFQERQLQQIYDVLTKKKKYEQKLIHLSQADSHQLTEYGSRGWYVVGMNGYYVIMEREL